MALMVHAIGVVLLMSVDVVVVPDTERVYKIYVGGKGRRREGRCLMRDMKWFVV